MKALIDHNVHQFSRSISPGQAMRIEHQTVVQHIEGTASTLAGLLVKVAQAAEQARSTGGALLVHAQMTDIAKGYTQLVKDWGALEHLQRRLAMPK